MHPIPHAALLCALAWSAASATAQVYRCGNTYTQEPCKGARVIDTAPPVTSHGSASPPGRQKIYLCSSKGGGQFWAQQHCHQHDAWIERTETVPSGLGWDEQVRIARSQRDATAALLAPPPVTYNTAPTPQPAPVPGRREACAALDERVKSLDSMGRAGSLHYDLDWVRRERKSARDEQYRLRC